MDLSGGMQISAVDTKVCPMRGGANKHWLNALFLVLKISFLIIFLCPEYSEIGLNSVPVTITKFKFKLWLSVVLPCGHVIEHLFYIH
jgi:hypothetical protein